MNQKKLDVLIEEIISLDPSLADHRSSLQHMLTELFETKQHIDISAEFISTLRKQVLAAHTPQTSWINSLFNSIHMNKKITVGTVGALATLVVVIGAYTFFDSTRSLQYAGDVGERKALALGPNAFGPLNSLQQSGAPMPPGAEAFVSSMRIEPSTGSATASVGGDTMIDGGGADMKMIMPWFQFEYNYVGEEFDLPTTLPVYRRTIGTMAASRAASAVRSVNNGIISLPSGLVAEQVSIRSTGNNGYSYQLDFTNEQVSLYEQGTEYIYNWNSRNRLSEEQLKQIATDFIVTQGISLDAYGSPVVDMQYLRYTENASEIPQFMTVIFPLMTPSGEIIYTQSGEVPAGIGITIDQARSTVTSAWNIKRAIFESSVYELTRDITRVLAIATQGGSLSTPWYSEDAERIVLALGTPTVVYTEYYRYNEETQKNEELYIPSLRFPVVSESRTAVYYSPLYITVPLVAELLIEPIYDIGVPMPRPMPAEPYDITSSDMLR
jgi:hypothetical protein